MLSSRKVFSLLRTANRKDGKGKSVQATVATAARKNTATKSLKNSIIIYCSMAQSLEKSAGRQTEITTDFCVRGREILQH